MAESELVYDITDQSDVDDPRPQSSNDDHDDDHHEDDLLYHHDEEEDDDEYELDMWEGQFSLTAPSRGRPSFFFDHNNTYMQYYKMGYIFELTLQNSFAIF